MLHTFWYILSYLKFILQAFKKIKQLCFMSINILNTFFKSIFNLIKIQTQSSPLIKKNI